MQNRQVIELEEGIPRRIPPGTLLPELKSRILRSGWLNLREVVDDEGTFAYELTATNVVGQVLVSPETLIWVSPKVPIGNLFGMLEVAYNLKSFQFGQGLINIEALFDLYERLASILARRVLDRVRKGLYRSYVDHSDALTYVRGRVDLRGSSRLLVSGSPALQCEYQEHTSDVTENQILAWTLYLLTRTTLQREDVRSLVRTAYRAVEGAAELRGVNPLECVRRFYTRLNGDYRPLHGLCRFFLESLGPGVERGAHDIMPYTVDMPRLFESFVAEWLRLHGPDQYRFMIQHALKLAGTQSIEWTVDILVKHSVTDCPIAVLDTKYKRSPSSEDADIQQVVAYAVEAGVERAFLIYPTSEMEPLSVRVGDIQIQSAYFDISGELDAAGGSLVRQLFS